MPNFQNSPFPGCTTRLGPPRIAGTRGLHLRHQFLPLVQHLHVLRARARSVAVDTLGDFHAAHLQHFDACLNAIALQVGRIRIFKRRFRLAGACYQQLGQFRFHLLVRRLGLHGLPSFGQVPASDLHVTARLRRCCRGRIQLPLACASIRPLRLGVPSPLRAVGQSEPSLRWGQRDADQSYDSS